MKAGKELESGVSLLIPSSTRLPTNYILQFLNKLLKDQWNNFITHCLSQLRAITWCCNAWYNSSNLVQCLCIDLYQLACDWLSRSLGTRQCISHCTFDPSSVHILGFHIVCAVICFVVVGGPPAKGSLLAIYQDMPLWSHTSRSVLDCLSYCSPLCLTLHTDLFLLLLPCALCPAW